MKISFLGTSAANAFPEAFCCCKNCEQARAFGAESLRARSSALVNDDLLIDLGPDIMTASQAQRRSLSGVRYCLQTHAHADHLDTSHFLSRSPGYGVVGAERLHFYASSGTLRDAARQLARDCGPAGFFDPQVGDRLNLEVHTIEPLQSFVMGPYRVMAFPANHDPVIEPLLYAIQRDGRYLFYGADTGVLPEETWRGFHDGGWQFDLVILDHTFGLNPPESDHMNARQFIEQAARLRREGLLAPQAWVFATHIAHDANPAHPQLSDFARRNGYEIAYDGLVLDIYGGAVTAIVIDRLTADNQASLNRCDNSFTVDSELCVAADDGRISYTVRSVAPHVKRYGPEDYDARAYTDKADHAAWLATVDGQPAGQILVHENWNRYAIIWGIAVDPPFRRRGVGRRLIEQAIAWARERGLPGVMLETQNSNVAACRLYESCGFFLGGFDGYLYRGVMPGTREIALVWYLVF